MARARGIKPGFFNDPDVVELSFEGRLLFIGLWTLADRAGRLEDRPRNIRMGVFPADNVDVDVLLNQIASVGLILRYEAGGKRYIQVTGFTKHQNPHCLEKPSIIPPPNNLVLPDEAGGLPDKTPFATGEHDASTMQAPCNSNADTMPRTLTPDSCILTPDSRLLTPTSKVEEVGKVLGQASPDKKIRSTKKRRPQTEYPPDFYPNAVGLDKASTSGLSVAIQLEKFKDFHESKGTLMADWQAGWRTWCSKAAEFANRNAARGTTGETAYQRRQRERVAEFAPDLACSEAAKSNVQPLHQEFIHVAIAARH